MKSVAQTGFILALWYSMLVVPQGFAQSKALKKITWGVTSLSASNWIPVGDKVGFVVTPDAPNQEAGVLSGYFLAWHEDSWKRIDSDGGLRFQPLHK